MDLLLASYFVHLYQATPAASYCLTNFTFPAKGIRRILSHKGRWSAFNLSTIWSYLRSLRPEMIAGNCNEDAASHLLRVQHLLTYTHNGQKHISACRLSNASEIATYIIGFTFMSTRISSPAPRKSNFTVIIALILWGHSRVPFS